MRSDYEGGRALRSALLITTTLGLAACGAPEAPPTNTARSASTTNSEAAADASPASDAPRKAAPPGAPVIEQVSIVPEEPVAGERVEAVVSLRGDESNVELGYIWRIGKQGLRTGEPSVEIPASARRGNSCAQASAVTEASVDSTANRNADRSDRA